MADVCYDYRKLLGRMRECEYTQDMLANKIGISSGHLNLKLNGKYEFRQTEIFSICDALKIPHDEIGAYFFALKV